MSNFSKCQNDYVWDYNSNDRNIQCDYDKILTPFSEDLVSIQGLHYVEFNSSYSDTSQSNYKIKSLLNEENLNIFSSFINVSDNTADQCTHTNLKACKKYFLDGNLVRYDAKILIMNNFGSTYL